MRHRFQMSAGGDPGGAGKVNAAFAGFAETHEVPVAVRRSLSVALDELLANAISHGLSGRDDGSVNVEAELEPERLTLTVTAEGPPFDPLEQDPPDTTLSIDDRPIGGLGIHLVRQLVDEVSYQRRNGRNVVVLVKRLAR